MTFGRSTLNGVLAVLMTVAGVGAYVGCGSDEPPTVRGARPVDDTSPSVTKDADAPVTTDGGDIADAGNVAETDADAGPVDMKFSFVIMPDTQQEVLDDNHWKRDFVGRVTWINDNWTAKDFRFVMHTGDAANWGAVDPIQFDRISKAFEVFDKLNRPYAISPGNHDTYAVGVGGSARPGGNASIDVRNTTEFNKRFPPSRMKTAGTFDPSESDNSFHLLHAGGVDWMIVTLELWPRTEVVNWAKGVVEAHPKHNVIFVTHMHLNGNGTISGSNGGYGANSPQYVFDNLYKKYENVRFVFSGHVGNSAYLESKGEKGNKLFQLLGCFHSNVDNPVRILEIDTAANTFETSVYAPTTNKTYPNSTYSAKDAAWVRP